MISIPEKYIFFINIAILIFYCILCYKGVKSGFVSQLIDLFGTIISFFVAWRYSDIGSSYFAVIPKSIVPLQHTLFASEVYALANRAAWFVILFLVCKIIFFLLSKLFDGMHKIPGIKEISSLLGGIFGLLTATIWIVVISTVIRMPIFSNGNVIYRNSFLSVVNETAIKGCELLGVSTESNDLVNEIYEKVKDTPDSDKETIRDWLETQGYTDKSN